MSLQYRSGLNLLRITQTADIVQDLYRRHPYDGTRVAEALCSVEVLLITSDITRNFQLLA